MVIWFSIVENPDAPSKYWKGDCQLIILQLYSLWLLQRLNNMNNHSLRALVQRLCLWRWVKPESETSFCWQVRKPSKATLFRIQIKKIKILQHNLIDTISAFKILCNSYIIHNKGVQYLWMWFYFYFARIYSWLWKNNWLPDFDPL